MRLKRILAITLLIIVFVLTSSITVFSETPGNSFTHWETPSGQKAVYMSDMYEPIRRISVASLGLEAGISPINDIARDKNGNIYLLAEDGNIIVFDNNYELLRKFYITENGEALTLEAAEGIYVSDKDQLYVSDSIGSRVLKCNMQGEIIQIFEAPKSSIIPKDFVFTPTRLLTDSKDYLYVVSDGAYYGALLYTPDGEFSGFYGANTVQSTVLGTLEYLWDALTGNDVKRSKSLKTLPYQFIDIDIDDKDFIYTCTGKTAGDSVGQVRRLNPGGTNVLYKELWNGSRQEAASVNFGENEAVMRNNKKVVQNFVSVKVDRNGMIYALDQTWGYIYVYDREGHLLTAFGGGYGNNDIIGHFNTATAMEIVGDKLYVVDSFDSTVTVFELTDYGRLVIEAQCLTLDADYIEAESLWQQVKALDGNSQLALSGLAKAAYSKGDYKTAAILSEQAYDRATYTQAITETFNLWFTDNVVLVTVILVLIIGIIVATVVYMKKKSITFKMNKKVKIMLFGVIHPFDNYRMLKEERLSSWGLSVIALALFYVTSFIRTMGSNFRYTNFDPENYNSLFQFLQTVGMIVLWVIANWGISTLMQGNGRFKEVFTVSSYATVPISISNILLLLLSNSMIAAADTLLSTINIIFTIFAGVILLIGLMVIHDYSFPKFIITAIIAVFFMILVVFVIFMIAMLLSQCWQFIVTLFMEAICR